MYVHICVTWLRVPKLVLTKARQVAGDAEWGKDAPTASHENGKGLISGRKDFLS